MAISMTGFGRSSLQNDDFNITVELKSINHKYLDFNFRVSRKINFLEENMRILLKENLKRGRVDVNIKFENNSKSSIKLIFDEDLARQYYDILETIGKTFYVKDSISSTDIADYPDVIKIEEAEADEEYIWNNVRTALEEAVERLKDMRIKEGKKLTDDILMRTDILEKYILEIEKLSENVCIEVKNRLNERINELLDDPSVLDPNRLAQEVAFISDKASITEEIVRFKSHIKQLRDNIVLSVPVGRKIDFIIQEMNRETNTIGSKSSDIEITNYVVEIKSEIEKIREQIQNIE